MNKGLPWERQVLYVLRHWQELHDRLREEAERADGLSRRLMDERHQRRRAESLLGQMRSADAKHTSELSRLRLRLEKSVAKNQELAERLRLRTLELQAVESRRGSRLMRLWAWLWRMWR